jgi:hypothetical protein
MRQRPGIVLLTTWAKLLAVSVEPLRCELVEGGIGRRLDRLVLCRLPDPATNVSEDVFQLLLGSTSGPALGA